MRCFAHILLRIMALCHVLCVMNLMWYECGVFNIECDTCLLHGRHMHIPEAKRTIIIIYIDMICILHTLTYYFIERCIVCVAFLLTLRTVHASHNVCGV